MSMSLNVVAIHPIAVKTLKANSSWWYYGKHQGITKVIRIHPLGTRNVELILPQSFTLEMLRYTTG